MLNSNNDEIEIEEEKQPEFVDDIEQIEDAEGSKITKLKKKLQECIDERKSHLDDLQRAKADFLNSKRRLEEEKVSDRKRLTISYIEKLLPLCDSFKMAMQDTELWEKADEKWRKGIEGIHNQLQKILSDYDVLKIESEDTLFDPYKHEALSNTEVDNKKDHNKITEVLQDGYIMKEDVIRHSKVIVGEYNK